MLSDLSGPTNSFGLRFLEQFNAKNSNKNVVFSPLSVILAYGMLLEGATGRTREQIKEVLQLSSIGDQNSDVSQAAKKLLSRYRALIARSKFQDFLVVLGNLVMVDKGYPLRESFVQSLKRNYFAQVTNEDFQNGKAIMDKLNSWVSEKTCGKIDKILSRSPNPDMLLLVINTVYFKGKWAKPFNKKYTFDETFANSDGTKSKIKMMSLRDTNFKYLHNRLAKFKIVELPYIGKVSMIFILPTQTNTLANFIPTLNSTKLENLLSSLHSTGLKVVNIPKFKLQDFHDLSMILSRMGMELPFTEQAEFKNITEESDLLFVSESIQKALIEVDEEGTVAVAVTCIKSTGGAPPEPKEEFILDRPFIFIIRDNLTRVNLFVGQMNKMQNLN
ncbi:plasminogen activator inhibitor 2 type A-like [Panonychus citri]|uniref:plasminogen activator inhibitor 2 type A-like n=1 Tax=Panonychus citri TaxID=50023 RepID=UPI002307655F|nr:plasminogen activator inhibitor 2 type A-like [Panonychus citri]